MNEQETYGILIDTEWFPCITKERPSKSLYTEILTVNENLNRVYLNKNHYKNLHCLGLLIEYRKVNGMKGETTYKSKFYIWKVHPVIIGGHLIDNFREEIKSDQIQTN